MRTITFALLMLITVGAIAQDRGRSEKMKEKIEAKKIAFITSGLDLTPEEAQKFWPIYNQLQADMDNLKSEVKKIRPSRDMTEAEATDYIAQAMEYEEKELQLRKQFIDDVEGVITMKKVAQLRHLEREFKRKMLDDIRKRYKRKRSDEGSRERRERPPIPDKE